MGRGVSVTGCSLVVSASHKLTDKDVERVLKYSVGRIARSKFILADLVHFQVRALVVSGKSEDEAFTDLSIRYESSGVPCLTARGGLRSLYNLAHVFPADSGCRSLDISMECYMLLANDSCRRRVEEKRTYMQECVRSLMTRNADGSFSKPVRVADVKLWLAGPERQAQERKAVPSAFAGLKGLSDKAGTIAKTCLDHLSVETLEKLVVSSGAMVSLHCKCIDLIRASCGCALAATVKKASVKKTAKPAKKASAKKTAKPAKKTAKRVSDKKPVKTSSKKSK